MSRYTSVGYNSPIRQSEAHKRKYPFQPPPLSPPPQWMALPTWHVPAAHPSPYSFTWQPMSPLPPLAVPYHSLVPPAVVHATPRLEVSRDKIISTLTAPPYTLYPPPLPPPTHPPPTPLWVEAQAAAEAARRAMASASAWRAKAEHQQQEAAVAAAKAARRTMSSASAWRAIAALREQQEAEPEPEPEAGSKTVHRRTVHLSAVAPRLLRCRPVVEAFTYDGRPLAPLCLLRRDGEPDEAAVAQHRDDLCRKADGTSAARPLRAAAATARPHEAVVNAAEARSVPHPAGGLENGAPQHVLHERLMSLVKRAGGREVAGPISGADIEITRIDGGGDAAGEPLAHILYVKEDSTEWRCCRDAADEAVQATVRRALDRPEGADNSALKSDVSSGTYVNHGPTVLWQHMPTAALPSGSLSVRSLVRAAKATLAAAARRLAAAVGGCDADADACAGAGADASPDADAALSEYEHTRLRNIGEGETFLRSLGLDPPDLAGNTHHRKRFGAPYRHANGREEAVQRVCEANAPIMGATARILRRHLPEVYEALWAPVCAARVVAPITVYPTPPQQQGRARREWEVWREWDAGPAREGDGAGGVAGGVAEAALPLGHMASRTSGLPEREKPGQRAAVALGVSNLHVDRVDSRRRHGVPIVYWPRISRAARQRCGSHPLPSSDLVLCENGCSEREGGGRTVRIRTCVPGYVCIVLAHYERCLHGGVYPCGHDGSVVDQTTGRPHLERALVPGVELLRLVLYQLARVDDFCFAVQAEYEARGDGSGGESEAQRRLVREVYGALDAPLDERFRMLHPWLVPKDDDAHSAPFGPRGRWQQHIH